MFATDLAKTGGAKDLRAEYTLEMRG